MTMKTHHTSHQTGSNAIASFDVYLSGRAETFEDFLEEFEGRTYECELTDLQ
jgi:hypothetical protein